MLKQPVHKNFLSFITKNETDKLSTKKKKKSLSTKSNNHEIRNTENHKTFEPSTTSPWAIRTDELINRPIHKIELVNTSNMKTCNRWKYTFLL